MKIRITLILSLLCFCMGCKPSKEVRLNPDYYDCNVGNYDIQMSYGLITVLRENKFQTDYAELFCKDSKESVYRVSFMERRGKGASTTKHYFNPVCVPIIQLPVGRYLLVVKGKKDCMEVRHVRVYHAYYISNNRETTYFVKLARFEESSLDPIRVMTIEELGVSLKN